MPGLARRMSFTSASGEAFGYVFFIITDFILINEGLNMQKKLIMQSEVLKDSNSIEEVETKEKSLNKIKEDRVMRLMGMSANFADLIIALAEIEPNPFCNHAVTLGISGLVSAWDGWYRNWPS
ncbi:hypothetical protein MKX01_030922 [Papaver californicum]|nr:hypothetical protein MKX01_030922 [Papaver californicum]